MSAFPLGITAVEHYMLADDSSDYPRCFWIILHFGRTLEEPRLRRAVDTAAQRHPLLRAVVEYDGDRPRRWIEAREPEYTFDWCSHSFEGWDEAGRTIPQFDLRRQPGLRLYMGRETEGDVVALEFHHACTDAVGAMQFVGDLLAVYAVDDAASTSDAPQLDPTRLKVRDRFGFFGWRRPLLSLYGTIGWLAAVEYLLHRPVALGDARRADSASGERRSGFRSRTLSIAETKEIVRAAQRERATVNDLLVRDLFLTLHEMFERHWPERARKLERIMVPVNLRTSGDESLPAANVVAMINIDRRPHRWTNHRQMLKVLHWELAVVKRLRLGLVFVQALKVLHTIFGSLRKFLPSDRCQATCVLSNLGIVQPKIEPELIRRIEFHPPIRPLTSAAVGVVTYAGRMTVSLHYDLSALTAEQGAELLDRIVERLRGYGVAVGRATGAGHEVALAARS